MGSIYVGPGTVASRTDFEDKLSVENTLVEYPSGKVHQLDSFSRNSGIPLGQQGPTFGPTDGRTPEDFSFGRV